MNVAQFIKWLEKQPQHLEIYVLEKQEACEDLEGWEFEELKSVCFQYPSSQSSRTSKILILGIG